MITDVSPHMPRTHGSMFVLGVTQLAMWLGLRILEVEKNRRVIPKDPEIAQAVSVDGKAKKS
ncbi:MAG: hypothetical protein MUO30_02110 [Anaerolineales bacterium]|nr:hypothetical protein [Anaerolineales bacterium]